MKVNLKLRMQNKAFWLGIVPAVLLLVELVASLLGFKIETEGFAQKVVEIINVVFAILAALGVVTDATTPGLSDSERALERETLGVD